jgi:hypothetical protein
VAEYFVVGPEQIVAQDLADAIRANDQQASVTVFQSSSEVIEALHARRPTAVIVYRDPEDFERTALGQALNEAEIPYGFLCAEVAATDGAAILVSPFTEATVRVLLDQLRERSKTES